MRKLSEIVYVDMTLVPAFAPFPYRVVRWNCCNLAISRAWFADWRLDYMRDMQMKLMFSMNYTGVFAFMPPAAGTGQIGPIVRVVFVVGLREWKEWLKNG